MGIGKSRGTSPINVNDMLEKVEINQQIEAEKSEVDKLLVEIIEAKETADKVQCGFGEGHCCRMSH